METRPKPLVVVVGETATGKSALAMELAKKFNGEIISADSWAVYKGFDIGTAKPSKSDQKIVPHHLLDVADPMKGFSAAEFKRQATKAIAEIQSKGKLPILVGGTGLYVDSVLFDYGFLPASSEQERKRLNAMSINELLDEIKKKNLDSRGIDIRNKRRLIRLIENKGVRPTKKGLRSNTIIVGLTCPPKLLKENINRRVDEMLKQGLEAEVKELSNTYGWAVEPMKGISYREFKDYFDGKQTLGQTKERIIISNNQLAKKQRTWFKRNKSIHWAKDKIEAVAFVTTELNK